MGITYIPRNKKIEALDVNFAGADILGEIGKVSGFLYISEFSKRKKEIGDLTERIPYKAFAKDARKFATDISNLTNIQKENIYKVVIDNQWFGGSMEEFIIYINEIETFFKNCSGYRTI